MSTILPMRMMIELLMMKANVPSGDSVHPLFPSLET
jgi:hypothetical protein